MMRPLACVLFLLPLLSAASLPAQRNPNQVWLGVSIEPGDRGIEVVEVVPQSPADKAGVKLGDVIVRVGERSFTEVDSFYHFVLGRKPGQKLVLTLRRQGRERVIPVVLGRRGRGGEKAVPKVPPRKQDLGPAKKEQARGRKGYLGVELAEDEEGRIWVENVEKGSPAEKAGLEAGDRILSIGGRAVGGIDRIVRRIQGIGAGRLLRLRVLRGEREIDLEAKLRPAPAAPGIGRLRGGGGQPARRGAVLRPERPVKTVWYDDFEKARNLARRSNRPLLIDFYADWCRPCKMLEKSFKAKAVQPLLAKAVLVRVDVDENDELADKFGVQSIPHVVVIGGDGKTRGKFTGYQTPEVLAKTLGRILGPPRRYVRAQPVKRQPRRGDRDRPRVEKDVARIRKELREKNALLKKLQQERKRLLEELERLKKGKKKGKKQGKEK